MSEIKKEVIELAAKIEAAMKLDATAGTVTETDGNVFEKTLPEDLNIDTVNKVHDHESLFTAATVHYVGNAAINAMSTNQDLKEVSGAFKMGKNTLNVQIDRSKEYTNHLNGNGEKTVKYGVATVAYDVKGSKKSGGQLKAVTTALAESAMSKLK
jgi:hypothetical protein